VTTHPPSRTLLYATRGPFYPEAAGGAEQSDVALFSRLRKLGWRVEALCRSAPREPWARAASRKELERLGLSSRLLTDEDAGFPCHRLVSAEQGPEAWLPWLDRRIDSLRPDLVAGGPDPGCPLLARARARGLPTFFFAHNLAALEVGRPLPEGLHVVADSPRTAERLRPLVRGELATVLELVEPDRYRVARRSPRFVTFVNPVPEKGLHVALEVARRLPEERFLFVKGRWSGVGDEEAERLLAPARELPNVEVWDFRTDMREVYAATATLLVPSQFEEAFGRVILEAHVNAIPVVAAEVGGIPYVLGAGGLLVRPKQDPAGYVEALRRLRASPSLRARMAQDALENSRRPELDPDLQVERFVSFVEERIAATP
jgi:glycosyltransferase involved in cell wall biosynthesis